MNKDTNVLGDAQKKLKYDDGLAGKINKDVEYRLKQEEKELKKNIKKDKNNTKHENFEGTNESPGEYIVNKEFAITMVSPSDLFNPSKDHDNWIKFWNNENLLMASLPELYHTIAQIYYDINFDVPEHHRAKAWTLLDSMRYPLKQGYQIITDTRIDYGVSSSDMTQVKVTHNTGSIGYISEVGYLDYHDEKHNSLDYFVSNNDIDFIHRALFNSSPGILTETIFELLKFYSDKNSDSIKISTLDYEARKNSLPKYATLALSNYFRIKLDVDNPAGLSFGVRYLKQEVKK